MHTPRSTPSLAVSPAEDGPSGDNAEGGSPGRATWRSASPTLIGGEAGPLRGQIFIVHPIN